MMMLKKRNNVFNYALKANDRYKALSIDFFCDNKIDNYQFPDRYICSTSGKILVKFYLLRSDQNWIQPNNLHRHVNMM